MTSSTCNSIGAARCRTPDRARPALPLAVAIACAAWGGLGSGCATAPAPALRAALQDAPHAQRATPYRLAIAPVEIDPGAALRQEGDGDACPVRPDPRAVAQALLQAAKASRRFRAGRILPRDRALRAVAQTTDAEGPLAPIYTVPAAPAWERTLDDAFAAEQDLVLRLRVLRQDVGFVEHNGWFIPNLVNLAFNVWPAWFVADERYEARLALRAELWSVKRRALVDAATLTAESGPKDVQQLDRGWMLTGSLLVPGWLEPENYARAGEVVLPFAWNDAARQLSRFLAETPLETRRVAGVLAVAAGVGDYQRRVQRAAVFSDDARAVAEALRDAARVPAPNVRVLTETDPTREAILGALATWARRAAPDDALVFYFSGFGFQAGRELYLVPADVDPTRPAESAISLTALGEVLSGCQAHQILVFDTSFGPAQIVAEGGLGPRVRTFNPEAGLQTRVSPPSEPARAVLERFARAHPRRTVLVATAAGEAAHLMDQDLGDQLGFFTARLVRALRNPRADRSGDGALDLGEVYELARRQTVGRTGATTIIQEPARFGADPKAIVIVPKRAAKTIGTRDRAAAPPSHSPRAAPPPSPTDPKTDPDGRSAEDG